MFSVPHVRTVTSAFVLGAVLASMLAVPVSAARPTAPDPATESARIEALVTRLEGAGASERAIDRAIERDFGYVRMATDDSEPVLTPMSTQQNVVLAQPKVYRSGTTGLWYVYSTFTWKKTCGVLGNQVCWMPDCRVIGDCGGPDGFGVRSERAITNVSTSFYTYTEGGASTTWVGPDETNAYGATWTTTDRVGSQSIVTGAPMNYNWHKGSMYFYFRAKTCSGLAGTSFRFWSRLNHTWDTTYLNGFGVSATGFSVSTGGGSSYWPLANATPTSVRICG